MHDCAVRLTGDVRSAVASAIELMILLNIDLRIAQIRPLVEKRVHALSCSHSFWPFFATDLLANRKAFEVATNMLGVISREQRKMIHMERAMKSENLESIARKLVAPGKGILAADESSGTIEKRLKTINVPSTEENRRAYREILFTTAGANEFISGVILFDETIRQKTRDGRTFVDALEQQGIIPGIKVDKGAKPMANFPDEKITEGLDGLRDRLVEYRKLGARFAKWRAVIAIGDGIPTDTCIASNAEALARYAALCQESDLVPIVEPEVLMDGAHTIEQYFEVTQQTLESVFHALYEHRILLEGMLLKPNMVLSGKDCPQQASVREVAEATVRCMKRVVPAAVPGIVFLSGGQSDLQATEHLNAMNRIEGLPWQLSFSYGRALQAPVLKTWKGDAANVAAAQQAFHHRASCNSQARFGKYTEEMETAKAAA
jgi:fructose-bisphosphate aldolase class I